MAKTSMAASSYKGSVFSLLNPAYGLSMESNKVSSHKDTIYPLTAFDNLYERYAVVMGWLVEGSVDPNQLGYSLDKVIDKWPLLGGRLERTERKYHIRIPTSSGHERCRITSEESQRPISDYISLPISLVSDVLPHTLFKHPQAPFKAVQWITSKEPLLHWHITHFIKHDETSYSCIGLTFPHVVFDGLGIASVIHTLEAELLNKPWPSSPSSIHPGVNRNLLETALDTAAEERNGRKIYAEQSYYCIALVNFWWLLIYSIWSSWQRHWHLSRKRILLFPPKAFAKLVKDTREQASMAGKDDMHLTRGDILAAFLLKTLFSDGTSPLRKVHMTSLGSLRRFFDGVLNNYPHNCVVPLPYPVLTVAQLKAIPLYDLSCHLAQKRLSFTVEEPLKARERLEGLFTSNKFAIPLVRGVDENIILSNVCIANIVNINWTGVGAARTICRYKTLLADYPVRVMNLVTASGYLDDGTLVLDVNLIKRRLKRLEVEIARLVEESEEIM